MAKGAKRPLTALAALGLVYFLLASLTIATTRYGNGVAILFIANAVLTAWLLTTPRKLWRPGFVAAGAASALATSLFGFGPLAAPVLAVINVAEAALAASLFRKLAPRTSPLESVRCFFIFVAAAGLIAPALSSIGGATVAALYGGNFAENALRWFTGHALGTLTFAPLSLLVLRGDMRRWRVEASSRDVLETATLLTGVVIMTALTFAQTRAPLLFLPWLPVMVATFRLGRLGGAASVCIVAAIAGAATLIGTGPVVAFVDGREAQLQFLQFYLAITVLAVLPTAAELAQRKALLTRVQESEQRYRMLADHSTDIILDIDLSGRIVFASAAIERLGGYRPAEVIGRAATDLIDPADVEKVRAAHRRAISAQGSVETVEYRGIKADGSQVWMETRTQGVFDHAGQPVGAVSAIRNVDERKAREAALAVEADTDGLTGALNRRAFSRRLAEAIASNRQAERGCLAIFDLDHFKQINDTHGHAAGDAVLIQFIRLARSIVRQPDVVGRLGGEEFAILLKGATETQALAVCDRLRLACAATIRPAASGRPVTVSAGVADLSAGSTLEQAMHRADIALYEAKRAGRNRLQLAA